MALPDSLLSALNTGNSVLKLLPYVKGTGANLASLNLQNAVEIYTLENSFQISKDAPSFSSTKIDQKHRVIESGVETGDNYTMQGNIPSVSLDLLSLAFDEGSAAAVSVVDGAKTYSGTKAYKYGSKELEYTVVAIAQDGASGIVFGRVRFVFSEPQHDDNTTPTYVHFDAVMLPNEHASGDFAPLPSVADTPAQSGGGAGGTG